MVPDLTVLCGWDSSVWLCRQYVVCKFNLMLHFVTQIFVANTKECLSSIKASCACCSVLPHWACLGWTVHLKMSHGVCWYSPAHYLLRFSGNIPHKAQCLSHCLPVWKTPKLFLGLSHIFSSDMFMTWTGKCDSDETKGRHNNQTSKQGCTQVPATIKGHLLTMTVAENEADTWSTSPQATPAK